MQRAVTGVNAAAVPPPAAGAADGVGDRRRTRWQGHRTQRRAELVLAAVAAIVEHGHDVDMEQVAAAAGVSKPVLYRYFADKAELWTAVGEHVARTVVDAVRPAVSTVDARRELVAAAVEAYLGTIEASPELYRFLMHSAGAPGLPHIVEGAARTVATELAGVIGDRLRALGLDAGGAQPWAYGIVGLVQSVGDWWIVRGRPMSRAALTEYLTTLLWDGLAGITTAADLAGRLLGSAGEERDELARAGATKGGLGER
jgi:AcrR family transcriptional regulator